MEQLKCYAVIKWTIEDLQASKPEWSEKQCAEWWKHNERWFKETLIQLGNEILSDIN